MKRKELTEIRLLTTEEIIKKVKTFEQELEQLVLDKNRRLLKNIKLISKRKKEIAQILTILRQKELLKKLEKEGVKK